jgi:hypothetical protein
MKTKGRKKTYDGFGCALRHQGESMVLRERVLRVDIEPSSHAAELAGAGKERGVAPRNALLLEVARAENPAFSSQGQNPFCV